MKSLVSDFFHSIRLRLLLSYLFVALLAVSVLGLVGIALLRANAIRREQERLSAYAEMAASQMEPLLASDAPDGELQAAAERLSRLGSLRVRVFSPTDQVLADSGHPAAFEDLQRMADQLANQSSQHVVILDEQGDLLVEAGTGSETLELRLPDEGERPRPAEGGLGKQGATTGEQLYIAGLPARSIEVKVLPVTRSGRNLGRVEVSEGPGLVGETLNVATRAFQTAGWIAALASLGVGWIVSSRVSAPLRKLAGVVETMQTGDFSARAEIYGQDEVGRLSSQFNRLAQRLETSFGELENERDTLRRFVADASHELRTPITAIKVFAELLEEQENDPQEQAALLGEMHSEIDRMAWITANLLDLSRMDAGIVRLNQEICRVDDLLLSACHPLESRAEEKQIDLRLSPLPPGIELACDRARLQMALTNLLDNALKFTPPGGWVEAGAAVEPGEVHFRVADSGPGIPPEELPYIFDRFYRGKDRQVPGSGLGLAIVRSIVEMHCGRVEAESQEGQGAQFTVHIPVA